VANILHGFLRRLGGAAELNDLKKTSSAGA
jgi:hypothetical protein